MCWDKRKRKSKGSDCQLVQIAGVYHMKVSARALDSVTTNPFPSHFLTHSKLCCPACCRATGVAASWAGEMASMHAEEEREETCPPLTLQRHFWGLRFVI